MQFSHNNEYQGRTKEEVEEEQKRDGAEGEKERVQEGREEGET